MKYFKVDRNRECIVFRKWSRKSFAVFKTLKSLVIIAVLQVNYLYASPEFDSLSVTRTDTTETLKEYKLDEIEVSAQRTPAVYSQVARIISVIGSKEIEAAPARSIQDLLEYVAGVDVRQRGAEGVQADVNIRGGTFDQTLILLNGINITDPQTGHHNLNIPVSVSQIERIEILEGPASRVYGPNAFSGAINIVTKQNNSDEVNALLSGGSYGYFESNMAGTMQVGKFSNTLSAEYKKSDGYIENTDFKNASVFYSNHFSTSKGKLSFQSGFSDKGFGANSFYTPKYPNQYEEVKSLVTSVKWESDSKLHLTPIVYWRRHQDRFELFRDNPPVWYKTHNYHLTNTYGGILNSWINWNWGKTAFGVEFRSENIKSNVLGEDLDEPQEVPGENAFFTKGKTRNIYSGFLEHSYYISNWTFNAGLLGSYISASGLGLNFFPGIDVSYKVNRMIKVFSSYNTSLRMPTFTDLYYSGPTNIGNPDLKPEYSSTIESGVRLNSEFIHANLVGFYRKGKDIIDWVKVNSLDKWQPQNLTELKSFGSEIQLQANLNKQFGDLWPDVVSVSYLFNNMSKEDFGYISYYVLDYLKNKINLSVTHELIKNLTIEFRISWQQREGTYTFFENGNYSNEVNYEPFWLVDGKINYRVKGFTFFTSASNIFNTKYVDIGNVTQPGFWVKGGVSYQISFK